MQKGQFDSVTGAEAARKSAASRRVKRGLRENIMRALAGDLSREENLCAGELIAHGLVRQAAEGNIKAAEFIRDTIGEKPGSNKTPETPASQAVGEIRIKVVE